MNRQNDLIQNIDGNIVTAPTEGLNAMQCNIFIIKSSLQFQKQNVNIRLLKAALVNKYKILSFLAGFDTIEEGMYTCSKQVADDDKIIAIVVKVKLYFWEVK